MNLDTIYSQYKNQTLYWLPMDTEELYRKNFKSRHDELKQYGWIGTEFTYKFNSHGFRCAEFTAEPTVMFVGCSFTVGIGLPLETIWPELVSVQLGMRCANLGIGGSSTDTAFRMCLGYVDRINPKIVIFMKPPPIRMEIFGRHGPENIGVASPSKIFQEWILDENNDFFNHQKNVLAMRTICRDRDIKFIEADIAEYHRLDYARDLSHDGVETHKVIAEDILCKINS